MKDDRVRVFDSDNAYYKYVAIFNVMGLVSNYGDIHYPTLNMAETQFIFDGKLWGVSSGRVNANSSFILSEYKHLGKEVGREELPSNIRELIDKKLVEYFGGKDK